MFTDSFLTIVHWGIKRQMAQNATTASASSINDKHDELLSEKNGLPIEGELPTITSRSFDGEHIFEDPKIGKYFVPIAEYEGMHR